MWHQGKEGRERQKDSFSFQAGHGLPGQAAHFCTQTKDKPEIFRTACLAGPGGHILTAAQLQKIARKGLG